MTTTFRESDWSRTLADALAIDHDLCEEVCKIIRKVAFLCLKRHVGAVAYDDMRVILSMVHDTLSSDGKELLDALTANKCAVHSWLTVIVRRAAMNHIRRRYYASSSVSDLFRAMNVDVRGAEDCLDAMSHLFTPSQKYLLRLRHGEGCDIGQAAAHLGISREEALALEASATKRLRQEWSALKNRPPLQ